MLPALILWSTGVPVLGLRSHPVPWCMVCGDRPLSDAEDTLESMGFSDSDVRVIPAFGQHWKSPRDIMDEIRKLKAQLVFWEGFDLGVRNPNNPNEVKLLLSSVTAECEQGLTVIGSVGVAKLKPHEMYQNPRQLVAGSSLWERATSTDMVIMALNPRDIEDGHRLLYVCLKNSASFAVQGCFDESGILVFDDWDKRLSGEALSKLLDSFRKRKKSINT